MKAPKAKQLKKRHPGPKPQASRMFAVWCSFLFLAFIAVPAPAFQSKVPVTNHGTTGWQSFAMFATTQSTSNNKTKNTTKRRPKGDKIRTKSSVDELVAGMGLEPVPKKVHTKNETANKPSNPQSKQLPSIKAQLEYARNGHCVVRNCINPSKLEPIRQELLALGEAKQLEAWRQKVQVASRSNSVPENLKTVEDCVRALDRLGVPSDQLPFLQYFNTWRTVAAVKELAFEMAEMAAVLLDVPTVKLYQDSFFWKRSIDGVTPWHVDARMAPFDTPSILTLWIPLHDIPKDGSALHFVSKTHADFALPFWNPYNMDDDDGPWNQLEERYQHNKIVHYMPMTMGDVTIHSGWTLHCADAQEIMNIREGKSQDRLALAISYVDARAPVRAGVLSKADHGDDEDKWSYVDWVKQVPAGEEFEHPLVPIVWPPVDRI